MSKELVCPFCQQKLDTSNYYIHCRNPHCNTTAEMDGTEEMWTALIRTRKALEMTDTALLIIATNLDKVFPDTRLIFETIRIARKRIAEITALEQKDAK